MAKCLVGRSGRYRRPEMTDELRVLTTASSEAEAMMVREWLAEASIHALARVSRRGIRLSAAAPREVFVYESDLERAREVLNAEMPSEEELAALRERAQSQPTRPARGEPMQIPVPERADVDRLLGRAARSRRP
jgi:hypothetical protein